MEERTDLRTWSFVSLLVGGVLILVGGLMGAAMMGASGWMGGMMSGYWNGMWFANIAWWMGGVGLLTGALVLLAAYQVRRARAVEAWGVVGIVAGALSLLAMGGFMIGAVAAIIGGALALVAQGRTTGRPRGT